MPGLRRTFDVGSSVAATLLRLGAGARVAGAGPRPGQPLELWDFEGCPYCRKAREALSILDLDARVYPCPKNGSRFRPGLIERGGKAQFPYLLDPNTGREMYESDDIVRYLFETYGNGSIPLPLAAGLLTDLSSMLSQLLRPGLGTWRRPSREPEEPLELYSYEASPFSRIVREELSGLELPYLLHNVATGSAQRESFEKRSGKLMVPYLVDPNSDRAMFESADIVRYLRATYALAG